MRLTAFVTVLAGTTALLLAGGTSVHAISPNTQNQQPNQQPETVTVVVNPGDTLSGIAAAHQTTYVRLFDANMSINDPDLIYPGQNLRIPAADEQLADRQLPDIGAEVLAAPAAPVYQAPRPVARPTASYAPAPAIADGSVWARIAQCESGGNWSISTGNGFYGGLQFTLSSWQSVGGSGYPSQASRDEQIARAQLLQARQGWGAWPVCSIRAGL